MDSAIIWFIILAVSLFFGVLDHIKIENDKKSKKGKSFTFLEVWRHSVNYFITATVVYYFVEMRWPDISQGVVWSISDFVLGIVFLIGVFGWLPYFVKNITEGINAIIARILGR